MQGLRAVIQHVTDQANRLRLGWEIICGAVAGVLFVFGVGYLVGGIGATSAPGAYVVLTRYVYGDLHTYGAVNLLIALAIIHGLLPAFHGEPIYQKWLRRVLLVTGGYCLTLTLMFGASWALSGTKTWQAMGYWTGEAVAAFGLIVMQRAVFSRDESDGRRASA